MPYGACLMGGLELLNNPMQLTLKLSISKKFKYQSKFIFYCKKIITIRVIANGLTHQYFGLFCSSKKCLINTLLLFSKIQMYIRKMKFLFCNTFSTYISLPKVQSYSKNVSNIVEKFVVFSSVCMVVCPREIGMCMYKQQDYIFLKMFINRN